MDEDKTMTPLLMVVRELTEQCGSMTDAEYEETIRGLLRHLHDRAYKAINDRSVDEAEALRCSKQYCAAAQLISTFGGALTALEDIETDAIPIAIIDDPDLEGDDDGGGGRMN